MGVSMGEADTVPPVSVRRHWSDPRGARRRASDLHGLHWDTISGGVDVKSPRPFLHGYIWCDRLTDASDFPHSCAHGRGPHRIKACVVKKDNPPAVFADLAARVEQH